MSHVRNVPMTMTEAVEEVNKRGDFYLNGLTDAHWNEPEKGPIPKGEFIKRFYKQWNARYSTCFYKDPAPLLPQSQCHLGARRSVGDLTLILRHYYPDTTLEETRNLLKSLVEEGFLTTYICSTVKRRVFWLGVNGNQGGEITRDEFGWTYSETIKP